MESRMATMWAPKTEEKIPKAGQERFWAVPRGQRRPSKRDPKKSAKNRADAGIRAADTFRHHWFWCPGRR